MGGLMEIKSCEICNRPFLFRGGIQVCDMCRETDREDYERVRDYVRENPGATIKEVEDSCDVTAKNIRRYLEEGRLEVAENSKLFLYCKSCGSKIKQGKYCETCSTKMIRGLDKAKDEEMAKIKIALDRDNAIRGMRYLKTKDE
jgi:hypothetical protein